MEYDSLNNECQLSRVHFTLRLRFLVHIICWLNLSPSFAATRKAFPAAKCSAVYNNAQLLFVLLLNGACSQMNNKYLVHLYARMHNSFECSVCQQVHNYRVAVSQDRASLTYLDKC